MRAKDNPFTVTKMHSLKYRFVDSSGFQSLLERLELASGRGAIVGDEGSGKSTLLAELACHFRSQGLSTYSLRPTDCSLFTRYVKLWKHLGSATRAQCVLIDSSERIDPLLWQFVRWRLRNCRYIVIAAHNAGRYQTVHKTETSPELLSDLLAELLPELTAIPVEPTKLFELHGGNIRTALRQLYDYFSGSDKITTNQRTAVLLGGRR